MQRTPTCKNCCRNYCFQDKNKAPNIPLLLECGHTFCEGCITKLARLHKTQVICPDCTYPTVLVQEGEAGVMDLQVNVCIMGILATNTYRKSLLERPASKKGRSTRFKLSSKTGMQKAVSLIARQRQMQVDQNQKGSHSVYLKCEECFSATANSRCVKCECVFCNKCFEKVHSSLHTLRKHKAFPLLETSVDTSPSGCELHDGRPFEFFDKDDNEPVCSHCVVVGEKQTHNVVPIEQMADGIKEQLQESLKDGRTILMHLEQSQKKISEALAHSKSDKMQLISEIREHFQFMSANLQVRENVLVKEVESCQSSGEALEMTVAEDIKKTRNLIMELEEALHEPTKLVSRAKGFMTDLEGLREKPCFVVKTTKPDVEESRFCHDESYLDSIRSHGEVQETEAFGFELKKLSEVSEDELNQQSDEGETESLLSEESSSVQDDNDEDSSIDSRRSLAARKLLNIPYRHELVQVTHIRDPSHFMVQRLADLEQLNVMMNAINKYCDASDASDLVFEANVGDMVCAQFTIDNHWYRARIMSMYSPTHHDQLPTLENGLNVQVMYTDYGNSEWIPMIKLRTMPARFLQVPDMAVCCSLVDIVPPFQQNQWPPKAIKAFGSLTGDKPLLMTALRRGLSGILQVDLKSPEDDEPTHDDDRPASVRDALVFLEVARFRSPASEHNLQVHHSFPMRSYKDPSPLESGQRIPVLISHATGPHDIYLQKLDGDEVSQLFYTMQEMETLYNVKTRRKDLKILWPYRGLVCGARFTEDKSWYRALVVGVNSDDSVNVIYVDYGNAETLPFTEIRKLPDALLGLPRQAHLACLADVKPCEEEDEEWDDQVRDFLCGLLLNKQFDASIIEMSDSKASVVLHDTTAQKNVSVNDLLVQSHHAVPSGLGIVKNHEEEESEKAAEKEESPGEKSEENTDETEKGDDDLSSKETENNENTEEKRTEDSETKAQQEAVVTMEMEVEEITSKNKSPMSAPERLLLQYRPAIPPVDKQFQAAVTYVGLDGSIYVQELKEGDQTLLNVMEKLNTRYNNNDLNSSNIPTSTSDLFIGKPCCALFSDDGMWYRAMVNKVLGENKVEVAYVDFGNSEVVPLSALRLDVVDIEAPKQCLQLVLYGVQPANPQGRWTGDVISFLSEMIVGKDCSAIIEGVKVAGQPLEVRLCSPDGINVADALLSEGLVRSISGVEGSGSSVQAFPAGMSSQLYSKSRKNKQPVSRVENKLQAMLISAREADNILPHTPLPQVGLPFDVTVTHVEDPGSFFIQRSPDFDQEDAYDIDPTLLDVEDELEKLEEMALNINKADYFRKYGPLTHAKKGLLCCGLYTEDDMWYRGQVLSVESDKPLRALVRYFDYGNSEVLTGNRMRGFPSELLDLPIQSTHCCLADINPPTKTGDSSREGSTWSPEAKEQLIELVAGKRLKAKIVDQTSPVSIILYDHTPGEDGKPVELSIGQTLAEKVLALSPSEDPHVVTGESHFEGAKSEELYYVENENDDVIEETSDENDTAEITDDWHTRSELEFSEYREQTIPKDQTNKARSDNLLEKLLSSRVGFAPGGTTPSLLTPEEFSVSGTKSTNPDPSNEQDKDIGTEDIATLGEAQPSNVEESQVFENGDKKEMEENEKKDEKEEKKELNADAPESSV